MICGDSYMAISPAVIKPVKIMSIGEINRMHWTWHLNKDFDVINLAQPGASNLMILQQLKEGIVKSRPSAIVLGFTSFGRLEFPSSTEFKRTHANSRYLTVCHKQHMTTSQHQLHARYITEYPADLRHLNETSTIEYAILLARSVAPTVHTMGLAKLEYKNKYSEWQKPNIFDPWEAQLPINLIDFDHWGPDESDSASFHIKNPNDHLKFADQINKWLLTI